MRREIGTRVCGGLFAALIVSGCATTETLVSAPEVELTAVRLASASFSGQTFVLEFDASNPNAFPLPVKAVKYRILFDNQKFARGETQGRFTIPAQGDGAFALTVEVDFLGSATKITSLLSDGMPEHVEYEVQGSLAVDIPLVRPLGFSNSGVIPIKKRPF